MPAKTLIASGVLYTDRRTFNLEQDMVSELYPSVTPFLSFVMDRASENVTDPDYKMFEHRPRWRYQTIDVNGSAAWDSDGTPGDTNTVTVDGASGVEIDDSIAGMIVDIWSSDGTTKRGIARVNSVTNSTTIVLKSLGNPTASDEAIADLQDDDVFYIVANAIGEEQTSPDAAHDELEIVWNSTGIHRTPLIISGTLKEALLRGARGGELARLRENKMKEHKIQVSRKLLMSYRVGGIGGTANGAGGGTDSSFIGHITDADGKTVRTTMGFIPALERYGQSSDSSDSQNVFDRAKANYTYTQFVEDMEKTFQYSEGGVKKAFCGPGAMTFWSTLAMAKQSSWGIEISGSEIDRFGARVRFLDTGHGVLELTLEPVLRRTPYANYMLVPDNNNLQHKVYRPTRYDTNIKTDDGYDGQKDEFFSDEGIGLQLMESHQLFRLT